MGRAAVQTGLGADLAHAQFLMIEAEAVENLRGPVDDMNAVTTRSSFRRPLKRFHLCVLLQDLFLVSYHKTTFRNASKGCSFCQYSNSGLGSLDSILVFCNAGFFGSGVQRNN